MIIIRLMLIFIFIALLFLNSCGTFGGENLINGSFEDNSPGGYLPDGWYHNQPSRYKKYYKMSADNSISRTGGKSVFISISKEHPPEKIIYNWIRRFEDFKEGDKLELCVWVKTVSIINSPFVEIECRDNEKLLGTASTSDNYSVFGTVDWQRIETIFFVPKGTEKIIIRAGLTSYNNHGSTVWFDDIQINKIN